MMRDQVVRRQTGGRGKSLDRNDVTGPTFIQIPTWKQAATVATSKRQVQSPRD